MAKAKMGAIVTQLAGKLNGHCFRVYRGMQVLQKNGSPSMTSNIASNPAMPVIRDLFSKWNTLDSETRRKWKDVALLYPVNDRWGFPKYLTAREMFTKCNINRVLASGATVDVDNFDGYIPGLEFKEVVIRRGSEIIELVDEHLAPKTDLQICIKRLKGEFVNPNPARIKTIVYIPDNYYTPSNLWDAVRDTGFKFIQNEWYAVSISAVSEWGMKSPFVMGIAQCIE